MMDESRLLEKLRSIEALFAGATTPGERDAAANARARITERLAGIQESHPVDYKFTMNNEFSRALFIALLRRYNLRPYRLRGQRHTTVMVDVEPKFVDEILWPQFTELNRSLHGYLHDVTHRVIRSAIHEDASDATVVDEPKRLSAGHTTSNALEGTT